MWTSDNYLAVLTCEFFYVADYSSQLDYSISSPCTKLILHWLGILTQTDGSRCHAVKELSRAYNIKLTCMNPYGSMYWEMSNLPTFRQYVSEWFF